MLLDANTATVDPPAPKLGHKPRPDAAAKSRDEANILRTKIAELDGRLGQTMKALSEARTQSEKV